MRARSQCGWGAPAAALTMALVAGCAPPADQVIVYEPLPPVQPNPAPPREQPRPVVPRVDLELQDGLPSPAVANCMSAVGEQAGNFNVAVLADEPVADGREVTLGVGENLTRWRCVANPSGEVVEVFPRTSPPQRTETAPPVTGDAL